MVWCQSRWALAGKVQCSRWRGPSPILFSAPLLVRLHPTGALGSCQGPPLSPATDTAALLTTNNAWIHRPFLDNVTFSASTSKSPQVTLVGVETPVEVWLFARSTFTRSETNNHKILDERGWGEKLPSRLNHPANRPIVQRAPSQHHGVR